MSTERLPSSALDRIEMIRTDPPHGARTVVDVSSDGLVSWRHEPHVSPGQEASLDTSDVAALWFLAGRYLECQARPVPDAAAAPAAPAPLPPGSVPDDACTLVMDDGQRIPVVDRPDTDTRAAAGSLRRRLGDLLLPPVASPSPPPPPPPPLLPPKHTIDRPMPIWIQRQHEQFQEELSEWLASTSPLERAKASIVQQHRSDSVTVNGSGTAVAVRQEFEKKTECLVPVDSATWQLAEVVAADPPRSPAPPQPDLPGAPGVWLVLERADGTTFTLRPAARGQEVTAEQARADELWRLVLAIGREALDGGAEGHDLRLPTNAHAHGPPPPPPPPPPHLHPPPPSILPSAARPPTVPPSPRPSPPVPLAPQSETDQRPAPPEPIAMLGWRAGTTLDQWQASESPLAIVRAQYSQYPVGDVVVEVDKDGRLRSQDRPLGVDTVRAEARSEGTASTLWALAERVAASPPTPPAVPSAPVPGSAAQQVDLVRADGTALWIRCSDGSHPPSVEFETVLELFDEIIRCGRTALG